MSSARIVGTTISAREASYTREGPAAVAIVTDLIHLAVRTRAGATPSSNASNAGFPQVDAALGAHPVSAVGLDAQPVKVRGRFVLSGKQIGKAGGDVGPLPSGIARSAFLAMKTLKVLGSDL